MELAWRDHLPTAKLNVSVSPLRNVSKLRPRTANSCFAFESALNFRLPSSVPALAAERCCQNLIELLDGGGRIAAVHFLAKRTQPGIGFGKELQRLLRAGDLTIQLAVVCFEATAQRGLSNGLDLTDRRWKLGASERDAFNGAPRCNLTA